MRFSFGTAAAPGGFVAVATPDAYTAERGYGFEVDSAPVPAAGRGSVVGKVPFFFSVRVPVEGNYRVTAKIGSEDTATSTTIKAELRRLMVERVETAPGGFSTVSFIVNTRTPKIAAVDGIKEGEVRLKAPRETTQEAWDWDDRITLEFDGARPALATLEVARVDVPTIFLIGDSTVCDQSREPYSSWGQMLTAFFIPEVAVANHAESGETYRDSIGRRRLDKILSVMKPGDLLLMQFGHNDQKQIAAGSGGPFTTYKEEIRKHVSGVRARGGIPVIVSPMERRSFAADGHLRPSLADYAKAARDSAKELGVAFIDLNAMSIPFYEALGADRAYLAFAGTGRDRDATHHDNYGAYELAKCIVEGLRANGLPVARFIRPDFGHFDPAHPDPVDAFSLPPSPIVTNQRPLGS